MITVVSSEDMYLKWLCVALNTPKSPFLYKYISAQVFCLLSKLAMMDNFLIRHMNLYVW